MLTGKKIVVGVSGGSASGKTLFLRRLTEAFEANEICLLSLDNYYHPLAQQALDEKGIHNFDTPSSIDLNLFARHLEQLIAGQEVVKEEYTFNNPARQPARLLFTPADIIIVEGLFVFYEQEIAKQLDLKIFIEANEHIKLSRRIARDEEERGYDKEDVLYRHEHHVAPAYEKFIEPFKQDADIIIPNNSGFDKALNLLIVYLRHR